MPFWNVYKLYYFLIYKSNLFYPGWDLSYPGLECNYNLFVYLQL